MKINKLEIQAFRNLQEININPAKSTNIICGDNAQGKTNILEAIWLFTGSKSFRAVKEKDFIPKESDSAGIMVQFEAEGREQEASIRWHNNKKAVTLNGVKKDNALALNGIFCGVIFTPDHLSLVKAGPEHRRNMIDMSLSQSFPKYNKAMYNYTKALKQRNALLKDSYYNASVLDMLDIWDEHIINYGAYITLIRQRYINKLSEYSSEIYKGISNNKEKLEVNYKSVIEDYTKEFALNDIKMLIKEELVKNKAEDIRLGATSVGPHRDDLEIIIDDLNARNFASQGQQRSSILAFKLAECEIIEQQTGETPVVMLDDVMSELDHNRKDYLLNKLKDKQVFITGCDRDAFNKIENGKIFFIKNGEIYDKQEV